MGSHNAGKPNNAWICVLEGPEDDLLGRNTSPWHVHICIQSKYCVNWLTFFVYLYIVTLRDVKLKKKIQNIINTSIHITKHPHITKPTHTHTHTLQKKLTQLQYKFKQTQYKSTRQGIFNSSLETKKFFGFL